MASQGDFSATFLLANQLNSPKRVQFYFKLIPALHLGYQRKGNIMPENKIGSIPDFTSNDEGEAQVEVKQELGNGEPDSVERDTPTEPPAEESEDSIQKPAEEVNTSKGDDTRETVSEEVLAKAVTKATSGLRNEITELRKKLAVANGADRKVIQSKIDTKEEAMDELKDLHPEDVNLIERVLRAKGYIKKEDASQMHYDTVKKEEITKFLDTHPEYKPENDPDDLQWSALNNHIKQWYRMPDDPRLVGELLLKAHREVAKAPSDRGTVEVKKQQVKIASSGSSGAQRSSPKPANPRLSALLRTHMQGWSDEEIRELEKKLPE